MPPKTSSRLALMGAKPSAASRDVAGVAITSYVCSSFEFEKLQRIKEWLGGEDFKTDSNHLRNSENSNSIGSLSCSV